MKFLVAIVALASSGLVGARAFDSGDGHVEARALDSRAVVLVDPECYIPKEVLKCIKKVAKADPFKCGEKEYSCWCTNETDIIAATAFTECTCAACGDSLFLTEVVTPAFDLFCAAVNA